MVENGLPGSAEFDPETLEITCTPGYLQAGTHTILVSATDDGDGDVKRCATQSGARASRSRSL
ncbi:MAG: Ig domain-containing protein [Candidatus Accumulibacter sp.]|nr:Ig domain-containing protein [Accumulibacter sp.]